MKNRKVKNRTRINIITSGFLIFLWLWAIAGAFSSAEKKDWKAYQQDYEEKISQLRGNEVEASSLGVRLIEVPALGVRDRCTTCHIPMEDLRMFGGENPLKPHPGGYLQQHPPERFGCTVCHGGQGEALEAEEAHSGRYRRGDVAQVSCARCHDAVTLEGAQKVSMGKSLLMKNQCTNCHYTGNLSEAEKLRPAPALSGIGEKVSEKWLWRWLKDPKSYMPNATMPRYEIDEKYVDGLVAYLMASKDSPVDSKFEYPEGDVDKGKSELRMAFCITCHPFNGKGGKEAGDLGRIGNKVGEKWLVQMLASTHVFQPNSSMPQYNLSLQQISDIVAYLLEEFTDYDMLDEDEEKQLSTFWASPEERFEIGRRVYKELRCANCHGLVEGTGWWKKIGPDFTIIGEKSIKEINFGSSKIPKTLPDYLFEKIRNPQIYATQENFMKMPKYDLSNEEIRDIVLALLSFNSDHVVVGDYRFPKVKKGMIEPEVPTLSILGSETAVAETYHPAETQKYDAEGEFGRLVDKFRCFSCHSFKGRGNNISYDLTMEGSRVRRKWLYNYLKLPYSIRPILTIRMPIFNLTDKEAKIFVDAFMRKMVDPEIERDLEDKLTTEMAEMGKELFKEKGCLGCHQVGKKGGYVGPSFTQGAFVGEKLQAGWIFKWLKNSRAMKPDVLEPNYNLSDEEALAVTAFLTSIKGGEESLSPKDDGKRD